MTDSYKAKGRFVDTEARLGKRQRIKRSHLKRFAGEYINVGSGGLSAIHKMRDFVGNPTGFDAGSQTKDYLCSYYNCSATKAKQLRLQYEVQGKEDNPLVLKMMSSGAGEVRCYFNGSHTNYFFVFYDKIRQTVQRSVDYANRDDAFKAYKGDYVSWRKDVFSLREDSNSSA